MLTLSILNPCFVFLDAKQFISLLLSKDKNRLSIKQALNHPWIVQNEIDVYQGEDYQ